MLKWEIIEEENALSEEILSRASVKGGWLVKFANTDNEMSTQVSLTFVPDAQHTWKVK